MTVGRLLQRKCACGGAAASSLVGDCEECRKKRLQRSAVRQSSGLVVPAEVDQVLRSPGRQLDIASGAAMQRRLGHDFSRVRIHDDAGAAASAAAVEARAYTVGDHVVFGSGEYRPGSPSTERLLAHELTHVIQQRRSSLLSDDPQGLETEATRAEHAFARGEAPVPVSASGVTLARDGTSGASDDATAQADAAEAACDIGTLCRLLVHAPAVVNNARINRVFATCHPDVNPARLIAGSPCLTPNFGLPMLPGASQPAAPTTAGGTAPRTGGSSGGLSLPSTTIRFNLGPAAFTIDLPTSVAIRLPVPFRGAQRVVFALNASTSEFSFTATIDAVPHVRIIARAGVTTSGVGSAGLTIQTTRSTCSAQDAASARSALQSAGERLRDAIQAVQNPPPVAPDASTLERTFDPEIRLGTVVSAIVDLNSAIERARAGCREVPVLSAEFGARGPLTTPAPGETQTPGYIGGSLTLHF